MLGTSKHADKNILKNKQFFLNIQNFNFKLRKNTLKYVDRYFLLK